MRDPNGSIHTIPLQNSKHVDCVDLRFVPLFSDSPFNAVMGSIDPFEMSRITRQHLPAFFNKHLKGMPDGLLDQTDQRNERDSSRSLKANQVIPDS